VVLRPRFVVDVCCSRVITRARKPQRYATRTNWIRRQFEVSLVVFQVDWLLDDEKLFGIEQQFESA